MLGKEDDNKQIYLESHKDRLTELGILLPFKQPQSNNKYHSSPYSGSTRWEMNGDNRQIQLV